MIKIIINSCCFVCPATSRKSNLNSSMIVVTNLFKIITLYMNQKLCLLWHQLKLGDYFFDDDHADVFCLETWNLLKRKK